MAKSQVHCAGDLVSFNCNTNYPPLSCDWYVNNAIQAYHGMNFSFNPGAGPYEVYCICHVDPAFWPCWTAQTAESNHLLFNVNPWVTPTFNQLGPYCLNAVPDPLPGMSIEGYTGTWNPLLINTAVPGPGLYTFTPDPGQGCITNATMTVVVNTWITPTFNQLGPYCLNDVPALLPGMSIEGYTGTWNPPVINTAVPGPGLYTFTPDAGQGCITNATMTVVVNPWITPTFTQLGPYCLNAVPDALPGTSLNGYTGTWNPPVINTAVPGPGLYTFTPDAGQGCITGAVMNVVVIAAGSSTTWTGAISNDWNNAGNWSNGVPLCCVDVIIPTGLGNYPTLNGPGSCHNITIKSDAAGTATLLDNSFLTVCGIATVQRFYSGNGLDWHLVSSPIMNATANVFFGRYLQSFSELTNTYTEITAPATPLNVMEGYGLYSTLGVSDLATFNGTLNTGVQVKPLSFTGIGWNLVGNPYVSSVDWLTVGPIPGMLPEVHYIDAATGADLWFSAPVGGPGSPFIPPMQGFFVRTTGPGAPLLLTDANRSHTMGSLWYKADDSKLVKIQASGEKYSDQAWVLFNDQAGIEHDGVYDVYKRLSYSNPLLPQIYTTTPTGVQLACNGRPATTTVPMGFTAGQTGTYTISALQTGEYSKVTLEDLFNGTFTDLLSNSYTFNYTAGDQDNRFMLHFNGVSVGDNQADLVSIYSSEKTIYIAVPANKLGSVKVLNMLGQDVKEGKIVDILTKLTVEQTGIYVVQANIDGKIYTKKVIIR